jgi:hypothetical protein
MVLVKQIKLLFRWINKILMVLPIKANQLQLNGSGLSAGSVVPSQLPVAAGLIGRTFHSVGVGEKNDRHLMGQLIIQPRPANPLEEISGEAPMGLLREPLILFEP